MEILFIIYYTIVVITIGYGLFFITVTVIGLFLKNKVTFAKAKKKGHFAILIAARNEEAVITNLIHSLKQQNYPKDKYAIYVLPNNCSDKTEEVSKKAGANVIRVTVPTKTKGQVLKFAFKKLKNRKEIDAYIVFDADNIVHPDFLERMNDCLQSGYRVAQGFRDAKNASDNWISGSYNIYYMMQNAFFYRARMGFRGSATINGTGFMVQKEYIDKYGFDTFTLTEDIEFSGQCALRKEKIAYVRDAITYDEYPTLFSASWKQRKRWSSGMINCRRLYSFKLIKNAIKNKSFQSLDVSLLYCGPMIQIISFIAMIMAFLFKIFGIQLYDTFSELILSGLCGALLSAGITILFELIALIYNKQKILPILSGVILFPLFMVTWLPINLVCLFKKQVTWEEIKHSRSITIDEKLQ